MSVIESEGREVVESTSQDVAVAPAANLPAVANPLDLSTEAFKAGLERRRENRRALMQWVGEAMVRGTDYDRIHVVGKDKCNQGKRCTTDWHFSKDTLFKPGAEKICGMLGLRVSYPTLPDYEQAALTGANIQSIVLRCELLDAGGNVVAHGIGARAVKQDYGDLNKALKMAAKSAHLDATLRCAGLSEMFTQDLEDMAPADADSVRGAQPAATAGGAGGREQSTQAASAETISAEQIAAINALIDECESTKAKRTRMALAVAAFFKVDCIESLPVDGYERCIRKLELNRKKVAA